ncbi:CheW protein [Trichodesmium erythraeum IMS101]|uniref:CheW protein n=1 Tax=Trichodesmium erythraeum (strain IMS101) TaxID=203124 RepID=Q118C5_TRIEI|nr:chemotaxis protein CheW [Trichodesmium erythraeum GBRTRLIN201]MCH2048532.1 chemotaxis protein CheW [Trichodesmium sp. ALOHA_ZT_67]MDE5094423.1 chemotaxis protein CheW [Trichodesmium sp. St11_bin5]MDT9338457.1 chemotaxis protein CheW [Trichodesmium erythraeum 21-75]
MAKQLSLNSSQQFISLEVTKTLEVILFTRELDEVITLDHRIILQIPGMPNVVVGVFQWQGQILWLIDLAYLMGFQPLLSTGYYQQKFRVVKVKFRDSYLGILVQKVGKLIDFESKEISTSTKHKRNSLVEKFIQGTCSNSAGEKKMILDIKAIIEYIEKT